MQDEIYWVDGAKALSSAIFGTIFLLVAMTCVTLQYWLMALLLFVPAVAFLRITCICGCRIRISKDGISKSFLGSVQQSLTWQQIPELWVLGTKVFGNREKYTGTLYLCFCTEAMSEDALFDTILNWPPKKIPHLVVTPGRLEQIQLLSEKRIQKFNVPENKK